MLDSVLTTAAGITVGNVALCTGVSLVLGVVIALVYMYRSSYTKNFVVTLALLPALVQAVILLVNGSLGTGIAVVGAFSLVRFRSVPGSSREIAAVFFAMAAGLATGMGYLVYAALFTAVVAVMMLLYATLRFGERGGAEKTLRVTIPEDLEYDGVFDDLFAEYTTKATLDKVRTTNLGSLFELQYTIALKSQANEKQFLDKVRQRNGNLSITCGRITSVKDEL